MAIIEKDGTVKHTPRGASAAQGAVYGGGSISAIPASLDELTRLFGPDAFAGEVPPGWMIRVESGEAPPVLVSLHCHEDNRPRAYRHTQFVFTIAAPDSQRWAIGRVKTAIRQHRAGAVLGEAQGREPLAMESASPPRIRWLPGPQAGLTEACGYVGSVEDVLFKLLRPVAGPPPYDEWALSVKLPGQQHRASWGGSPEELKVIAEERLEEFVTALGAVFPDAGAVDATASTCRCCSQPIRLLEGTWTGTDGDTCCAADPEPGFTPHLPSAELAP